MGNGRITTVLGLPRPGDTVSGRYRILRQIGAGGMGVVFECHHLDLGREVALKFLQPHVSGHLELVERFMREARAAASISHPCVIDIFEVGWTDNGELPYLVMELLQGRTLTTELLRVGPMTVSRAASLAEHVLGALEAAHAKGIVHRDLKPANIFLLPLGLEDGVKVLDFGISKILGETTITQTGTVLGTPSYMSPEQARGSRGIDHRTDIYSAGAILYEMLTGQPPYDGRNYNEIIIRLATEPPKPMTQLRPTLHPGIVAVVERALSRKPDNRWQSAREMAAALDDAVAGVEPIAHLASECNDGADEITTSVKPTPAAWERSARHDSDDRDNETTNQLEPLRTDEHSAARSYSAHRSYPSPPVITVTRETRLSGVMEGQGSRSTLSHRWVTPAIALALGAGVTLGVATWRARDARPPQGQPTARAPRAEPSRPDPAPSAKQVTRSALPLVGPTEPAAQEVSINRRERREGKAGEDPRPRNTPGFSQGVGGPPTQPSWRAVDRGTPLQQPVPSCRLQATVAPSSAQIILDEDAVGTEIDLPFPCGSRHRLSVSAPGYVARQLELRAKGDGSPLQVRLRRVMHPRAATKQEHLGELEANPF